MKHKQIILLLAIAVAILMSSCNKKSSPAAPYLVDFDTGENTGLNGTPDAAIGMWGAIAPTGLISASDTKPVLFIHGMADSSVPFASGHPFGFN